MKKLPDELRVKYSFVEWKDIAGMRDVLIHNYFGVDYELVWDVIQSKIPDLEHHIKMIIEIETNHKNK